MNRRDFETLRDLPGKTIPGPIKLSTEAGDTPFDYRGPHSDSEQPRRFGLDEH